MLTGVKAVIGWSMEAALLAFKKDYWLILPNDIDHSFRDRVPADVQLGFLEIENDMGIFKSNYGNLREGLQKQLIADRIRGFMSVHGMVHKGKIHVSDNIITVYQENSYSYALDCDDIVMYNSDNITGAYYETESIKYEVIDYFSATLRNTKKYNLYLTGYKRIAQELWILPDNIAVISYPNKEEYDENKIDEITVRLMLEDMFDNVKDIKLKGRLGFIRREATKSYNFTNNDEGNKTLEDILSLPLSDSMSLKYQKIMDIDGWFTRDR